MGAKYAFAGIAVSLLMTGTFGRAYGAPLSGWPKRAVLAIGVICGVISVWMFYQPSAEVVGPRMGPTSTVAT
jgi:hypothetical protein